MITVVFRFHEEINVQNDDGFTASQKSWHIIAWKLDVDVDEIDLSNFMSCHMSCQIIEDIDGGGPVR
jgi:hypothetical protein